MLLAVALGALVPLAHTTPPDPTWIAGLWDEADHDDVVLAIIDASGSQSADGPAIVPAGSLVTAIAFVAAPTPVNSSRISLLDRSPPLS